MTMDALAPVNLGDHHGETHLAVQLARPTDGNRQPVTLGGYCTPWTTLLLMDKIHCNPLRILAGFPRIYDGFNHDYKVVGWTFPIKEQDFQGLYSSYTMLP